MEKQLRDWARTFRGVGSNDVAELLEDAAARLEAKASDPALAAELIVCAMTREHLWEQQSVAALMRSAADMLRG